MNKIFRLKSASFLFAVIVAVGLVGVPVSAASGSSNSVITSNSSSWNVFYTYGIPTNLNKYSSSGTVTGLVQGVDTGITFNASKFNQGNNSGLKVYGTIPSNLNKDGLPAILTSISRISTCLFVNNWYALSGGSVTYTAQAAGYVSGENFDVAGSAY